MRFIIGENSADYLTRVLYRGVIGIFYDTIMGGLLAYIIFGIIIVSSAVGLFTIIKWLLTRKSKNKYRY